MAHWKLLIPVVVSEETNLLCVHEILMETWNKNRLKVISNDNLNFIVIQETYDTIHCY